MSFSGGGGSTGVTAHVHSNAAGEAVLCQLVIH